MGSIDGLAKSVAAATTAGDDGRPRDRRRRRLEPDIHGSAEDRDDERGDRQASEGGVRREANAQGSGLHWIGGRVEATPGPSNPPRSPADESGPRAGGTATSGRRPTTILVGPHRTGGLCPDDRLRRARSLRRRADAGLDRRARGSSAGSARSRATSTGCAARPTGSPSGSDGSGPTVDVVELPGRPDVPSLVVGEIGDGPRTLNAVQHYDVQPAVPLDLWTTPPYEPAVRDGRLFARGATDNKGELMPRIWAVEAYLATIGPLPCRVRFLVEGEEEYGSEHLDELLDQRPGIRRVEGALIEGGGVDLSGRPEIVGRRPRDGRRRARLPDDRLRRPLERGDHPAERTGPPGPGAGQHVRRGRIPVGAGDRRRDHPAVEAQLAIVDTIPLDVVDEFRQEFGVTRLLGGLDGVDALRALTFAPTLNIQGLWSGFIGPGDKTITPAEAHARLDIRIVPDQEPETVVAAIRAHLAALGFDDIEVIAEQGERPYWTPADHPLLDAAARVSEAIFELPSVRYVSMPGTAPMWQVCGRDQVPSTSLGGGSADCRAHAPNENVRLDYAGKAAQLTARFLDEFAALR